MTMFGWGGRDKDELDAPEPAAPVLDEGSTVAPEPFPPAGATFRSIRDRLKRASGTLKISRRGSSDYVYHLDTWALAARFVRAGQPDLEIEIFGQTLDEVCFTLLQTLEAVAEAE